VPARNLAFLLARNSTENVWLEGHWSSDSNRAQTFSVHRETGKG
jgi:hypothetical protein